MVLSTQQPKTLDQVAISKNKLDDAEQRDARDTTKYNPSTTTAEWILFALCLELLFAAVTVKLAIVQGVKEFYYHQVAQKQYESEVPLLADRGVVFDRNGSLVISRSMVTPTRLIDSFLIPLTKEELPRNLHRSSINQLNFL